MESAHRDAEAALEWFEREVRADDCWPMFGTSLFWLLHFRLFFAILNRSADQTAAPTSARRRSKLRRVLARLERIALAGSVLAKGALALALNRRKRGAIVFVTSQTNLQHLFDPGRNAIRLMDAHIDYLRPQLAEFPHIVFQMDSFANQRNMFRALFRRALSVIPDMYFDLRVRLLAGRLPLPELRQPEGAGRYLDQPLLAKLKADTEERGRRIELIAAFFRRVAPRAVVAIDENGPPRDYIIAARHLGIPTFGIQHGIIHEFHPSYMYPRWARNVPLPDKTFVFGEFTRRLLVGQSVYREDQVEVTGQQRLSQLRSHLPRFDRAALRVRLGMNPGERLVVFASQPVLRSHPHELRTFFEGVARTSEPVRLLVKLHPGDLEDDFYRRLAAAHGFALDRLKVTRAVDLYEAILSADRVVGMTSTVLAEAIVLGADVGLLDVSGWPDRYEIKETSLVTVLREVSDVLKFIRAGTRADASERTQFTTLHYADSLKVDVSATIADRIRDRVAGQA